MVEDSDKEDALMDEATIKVDVRTLEVGLLVDMINDHQTIQEETVVRYNVLQNTLNNCPSTIHDGR